MRQRTAQLSGSLRASAISSASFPRQDSIAEMQSEDEVGASEDDEGEGAELLRSGFFEEEDDDNEEDDDDDDDDATEVESLRAHQ